jgi:5-formyltetrahydrofolate cyclo-ligase
VSGSPDKSALRAELRRLRRRLAGETPAAAERAATRLPVEQLPAFEVFSGYMPQGSELDPGPLMRRLKAWAKPALPAAFSWEEPLEFRLWGDVLEPDAFGIPAPPTEAEAVLPDLVIAPLLAFDRAGGRLGQGAGHYDRAIANLRRAKPVFVLGLAYAGQEVAELPMEPHDQRLDAILTETEFIPVAKDS